MKTLVETHIPPRFEAVELDRAKIPTAVEATCDASRVLDDYPMPHDDAFYNQSLLGAGISADKVRQQLAAAQAACSQLAWGYVDFDCDATPSPEQAAALLDRHGDKLRVPASLARRLRALLASVEHADAARLDKLLTPPSPEQELRDREEFERVEVAEKERRFQEWRAKQGKR